MERKTGKRRRDTGTGECDGMTLIGLLVLLFAVASGVYWWMGRGKGKTAASGAPAEMASTEGATPLEKLRAAAETGDSTAAWKLGKMFPEGVETAQDRAAAVAWFRKSAQAGNPEGEYQLGLLHKTGQGVPQDWEQATEWSKKAAEQDHADAQWKMGRCHRGGTGVAQDPVWAKIWLDKTAR